MNPTSRTESPRSFLVRFALLACVAYVALRAVGEWLLTGTARLLVAFVRLLGGEPIVHGNLVIDPRRSFEIVADCTGALPVLLFVAGVLATRETPSQRAVGALVGSLAIVVLNQARLVGLWYLRASAPSSFELVHTYIGQPLMLAAVVLLWLVWLEAARRGRR